jgi:AraC family transcriptional regulator
MDALAIQAGAELLGFTANLQRGTLSPRQVDRIRDYVSAHLSEDISVSDLAALVGLSVFHFTRRFQSTLGSSPYRFILESRIERAKEAMRDPSLSLSVVARACGFGSASHFSKAFTNIVGATPSSFRRLIHVSPCAPSRSRKRDR